MNSLGYELDFFGGAIEYDDQWGSMILNQAFAICQCLHKYFMEQWKHLSTPMEKNTPALLREESETIYDIP